MKLSHYIFQNLNQDKVSNDLQFEKKSGIPSRSENDLMKKQLIGFLQTTYVNLTYDKILFNTNQ
jgi:hypothetical protein